MMTWALSLVAIIAMSVRHAAVLHQQQGMVPLGSQVEAKCVDLFSVGFSGGLAVCACIPQANDFAV